MERTPRVNLVRLLHFAGVGILLVQGLWSRAQKPETVSYSRFEQLVREDKVQSVQISEDEIRGQLCPGREPRLAGTRSRGVAGPGDARRGGAGRDPAKGPRPGPPRRLIPEE